MYTEEHSIQERQVSNESSIEVEEKGPEHEKIKNSKKFSKFKSKMGGKRIYERKSSIWTHFKGKTIQGMLYDVCTCLMAKNAV